MKHVDLIRGRPLKLTDKVYVKHPTLADVCDLDKYENYTYIMMITSDDIADVMWHNSKKLYTDIKSEWLFFIQKALISARGSDVYVVDNNVYRIDSNCVLINSDYRDALNYFLSLDCEYMVMTVGTGDNEQITLRSLNRDGNMLIFNKDNFQFTESFYLQMVEYLRQINDYHPDYYWKKCPTKRGKKMLLEQEYRRRESREKNNRKSNVDLGSLVSALIARGQPYKEIWDYPIYMIYDLYRRLSKVDEYNGTMRALYSGCIDTKKNPINWDKVNWAAIIN
jgi:hypothetical protein|nr:MAG TPA: hypothetical protein [Bacteriophage sp.]